MPEEGRLSLWPVLLRLRHTCSWVFELVCTVGCPVFVFAVRAIIEGDDDAVRGVYENVMGGPSLQIGNGDLASLSQVGCQETSRPMRADRGHVQGDVTGAGDM
jgi:hypothetical protein